MRLYLQVQPKWHRVSAYALLILGVVSLGLALLEWLLGGAVNRGDLTAPTIMLVIGAVALSATAPSTNLPEAKHPRNYGCARTHARGT